MTELHQRRSPPVVRHVSTPHSNPLNKTTSSSPLRMNQRPSANFKTVLLLVFCTFTFYLTTLRPIANRYSNLGGERNKASGNNRMPVSTVSQKKNHTEPSSTSSLSNSSRIPIRPSKNLVDSTFQNGAIECQLGMEKYLYPLIYQWVLDRVPIAMNVKIIDNQYHVIFNTGYIDPDIWYTAEYRCNGSDEIGTVLSASKPGKGNLVLQCPKFQKKEEILKTVSVIPTKGGNVTTYNMERFVECEELDIKQLSPPKTSIGMCTSIAGKGKIRNIAHEWAEYHKLIGVDHTWVYINSDWDDGKHPEVSHVTWIPYNLNIKGYNFTDRPWTQRSEFFRVTSQVECVLRARRMGLKWIVFTDVDEYIQIVNNTFDSEKETPALKELLSKYYEQERNDIGGLVMNSIPFGNNLKKEKNPMKSLMIDHVYRNKINPKEARWTRWKQIVNPQNVHSVAIHWLGGGDVLKEIRLDADKVRINHYKEVSKGVGVFQTESADDLIEDRILSDDFHNRLVKIMNIKSDKS